MNAELNRMVGVVVIGRNEGERLKSCMKSIVASGVVVVYVDSGSTDDSVGFARSIGIEVVELDASTPFTAARARNHGWRRLNELSPSVAFVQFIDGDCMMAPDWLDAAATTLQVRPEVVAVCGRRRESNPSVSSYNQLCDLEWDTPIGVADSCGGDAIFRNAALQTVDGFRESLIAGEEPELCYRLRANGGTILRIDHEMTRHDAAMTSFRQWWRRAVRAGHAYAEGYALTGRLWRREVWSIVFWGCVVPIIAVAFSWWSKGWSLLLFAAFAVLWLRIFIRALRRWTTRLAGLYATFAVIAKFAHVAGMILYYLGRLRSQPSRLIEYKSPGPVVSSSI